MGFWRALSGVVQTQEPKTRKPDVPGETPTTPLNDYVRAAIVLGLGLIGTVFTTLGIQGDLLTRAVRNHPGFVVEVFAVTILGLALPFFNFRRVAEHYKVWLDRVSIVLVVVGALSALLLAVFGSSDRELPSLILTSSPSETNPYKFEAKVSAESLRVNEDVVLRVVGINPAPGQSIRDACRANANPSEDPTLSGMGRILSWHSSGPAGNGTAAIDTNVSASRSEFRYICASATLRDRSPAETKDDRIVWAIIDLNVAPALPAQD